MNFSHQTFGGLRCQLFDALPAGASPQLAVVLCHGFGAPGTDLVGFGPELLTMKPGLREAVRFVFPEAPLSLEAMGYYGARAWWHLDIDALMRTIERGEIRNLRNDMPVGLESARESMLTLVREAGDAFGLPASRFVLGGFSQGGMIATETALRLPETPAGLGIFSGTLLCEQEWKRLAEKRGPLRVFQSHGRQDPILPYIAAEWLHELLRDSGFDVEFLGFQGPHTIPREALVRFAELVSDLADQGNR